MKFSLEEFMTSKIRAAVKWDDAGISDHVR